MRIFVQAFGSKRLDAALLRLPTVWSVDYRDERMVRTTDAVFEELAVDDRGLLRRHELDDGLKGSEGAFIPCSFWLARALVEQGRHDRAREVFDRATAAANRLGLFSE